MKIAVLHINGKAIDPLNKYFLDYAPDLEITNLLDESILGEINDRHEMTPSAFKHFAQLFFRIEDWEFDGIFIGCSMFSAHASLFESFTSLPVIGIDQPMIKKLTHDYQQIGVLGTNLNAVELTSSQIRNTADGLNKKIELNYAVVDITGLPFDNNYQTAFTEKLLEEAEKLIRQGVEIIVFTQVSMTIAEDVFNKKGIPTLSSPVLGIQAMLDELKKLA